MAPVIPRDHFDGRRLRQRRVDPREVFEVLVDRHFDRNSYRIHWRSRLFHLDRSLEIRNDWIYRGHSSPEVVAQFIEELVGRDLMNWAELGLDGHAMGLALAPQWDRAVFQFMERLERAGQYYGRSVRDYMAGPAQEQMYAPVLDDWRPATEDPAATLRARDTLLRHLDEAQRAAFEKDKKFTVTGKDGKAYVISRARSFNVTAPDGTRYCGQLQDCPLEDQMLAQKLLLQNDPEAFFKKANVSHPARSTADLAQRIDTMILDDIARF